MVHLAIWIKILNFIFNTHLNFFLFSQSLSHNHAKSQWFSRYSTAGSTHTLNNYCDTSDNWTDHDMDIYMARNPTTRNGLVPLWGRLLVSWYFDIIYDWHEIFWPFTIADDIRVSFVFCSLTSKQTIEHSIDIERGIKQRVKY